MTHLSKFAAGATSALAISVVLAGAAAAADLPAVITIAGPSEGASGYVIATGFGASITKHTPIKKVVVQPFAGGEAWPSHMQNGSVNFGQHCAFKPVEEAYWGKGVFKSAGPMRNIRGVARAYGLPWAFHTVNDKVKKLEDLKGKAVFVQPSHTDLINAARLILREVGLTLDKDVKGLPFRSPREAIQGMMTGRADAMAYGAIPALAEVERSKGAYTIPIPAKIADKVMKADPVWGKTVMKKGFGPTKPEQDTPVMEVQCGLAAGTQTSADTVYAVMKVLYEHTDEWKGVHPLARQWTLKNALDIFVVPFHDGAIRYFKEKGIWTAEHETRQKAMLAKN